MRDSPPKKDPLPKSSAPLSHPGTASESSTNDDLEPDERSSALYPSRYTHSSAIKIERKNHLTITPNSINYSGTNAHTRKTTKKRDASPNLNSDIGFHMANLLTATSSNSPTSRSVVAGVAGAVSGEYSSSVDSDMSPVFTSLEYKDSDSLSSLGSFSSSPKATSFQYETEGIIGNLDPISESSENSPTPDEAIKVTVQKLSQVTLASSSSSDVSPPLTPVSRRGSYPVDIDAIITRLIKIGNDKPAKKSKLSRDKLPFTSEEIKYILNKSRSIFLDQPTLLRLAPPVKVLGDLHGQYTDLIRIFNKCGYPPHSNYLFLGDYVDRGHKSLETILLLLCYKIKYPENFFMLRGNHESANITKIYGFYDECKRRLPSLTGNHKMWKMFVDVFNSLPIAATINDKIFCIHGGLSPDLHNLKQIEDIKRPTDVPDKGLLADLLWSDPDPSVKNFSLKNWPKNDRGVSYCFGRKHVDHFCATFGFELIVRGHMVVEDGYEFFDKRKLVTIFSAPNYCGEFNNYGAVMSVDRSLCCSFDLLKPL